MEPIIAGRDLRKSWGATLVLEHADFLLHVGDKVALVGPNGSGKSTLFRLLAGETATDPTLNARGVGEELLARRFGSLSGGEKSKVLTARALANAKEKDVLLLDEPTNHMDVDTIETIEAFLQEIDAAVLLASHDKFLLDAIADKVIEIDRLRTLEYVGNYTDYRVQRDAIARAREAQRHRHQAELKRQLAIIEAFKSRKVYEQVLSRKLRVEQMRRGAAVATAARPHRLPPPLPPPPGGDQQRAESAAVASVGEGPPRPLLVPGGRRPQPRRPAQRGRTRAPRPREVHRPGLRPPRPRRADEPPRHREPRDRRSGPGDVSGHAARREPQPLLPERGGEQDRRHRAPAPRRLSGDLQGFVGRGEDGGVHGGGDEASVPRPPGGRVLR